MKSSVLLVAIFYTATVSATDYTILYNIISEQIAARQIQNPCISRTTCHECIQTPSCAWCFDPEFGDTKRCYHPAKSSLTSVCREEYSLNPDNQLQVLKNMELSKAHSVSYGMSGGGSAASGGSASASGSASSSNSFEIVQVAPQHINLKLRINESYQFRMYYTAEDYPVDLYYLMDLSKSMEDNKDKLSSLGNLLAESMQNITSDFRLGFGSITPQKLKAPCENCEASYGFRNHMTLNTNTSQFLTVVKDALNTMVKNATVSGNLDATKGGFDAIMQAIVCQDEIGWREKARKFLVFSTDAGFHYAGDGKLGGIITPNDGVCHLDSKSGYYTHSSVQDYPSISQISSKVKENSINVIFAVTEEKIEIYKQLQAHIEGSSIGKLSSDLSNVVDLVKEQYQQISSSVEMKDDAKGGIRVNYYSTCLNFNQKQTNKCENLQIGDVVRFDVEIEVTSCPKDPKDWRQTLHIKPVGINETLTVDLEMLCSCPCEYPGGLGYKEFAKECSGNGIYKCGICECDPAYYGTHCECSTSRLSEVNHTQSCRPATATFDCSGRGNCVCGQCECFARENPKEVFSGQFCECDNFSCDRHIGILCSGHGDCVCGQCQCYSPWIGSACSCTTSNDTCYPPHPENAEICSGHGECVCGQCECEKTENMIYSGKYCEKCRTCPDRCLEFKECVQCQMYKTGPLSEQECVTNCTFVPITVPTLKADMNNDHLCLNYDEDDCRFAYVYYYDENNKVTIRAQQDRDCPRPPK